MIEEQERRFWAEQEMFYWWVKMCILYQRPIKVGAPKSDWKVSDR